MGKESNFGDKINSEGFDKNPKNINKTGVNRRSFASINLDLTAKGIKKLSKGDYMETCSLIFNCTIEDLKELTRDDDTPVYLKLMIQEFNNPNTRLKMMSDFRDYTFGKAQDKLDITSKDEAIKIHIDLGN